MKTILTVFALFILSAIHAQDWQRYTSSEFGFGSVIATSDALHGTSRHFRINPYTNIPWFARQNGICTFTEEGSPILYWPPTEPVFQGNSFIVGFEFMPNKVIALDEYYGLKLFENDVWSDVYSSSNCNGMTLHYDTIYLLREQLPAIKWANGTSENLDNFGTLKRIIVHNERLWLANSFGSPGLHYHENGLTNYYDKDTCLMMDYTNFEFKYSPHTDTLYVSGDKGLSMLYNNTFFDSIAPDNTTNMPSGKIIDFEFDADDNIWALFGTTTQALTSIAHYDQPTKTWDAYYDNVNSNLNMTSYGSIELDTSGNVWMAGNNYFYVLEITELPVWLATKKLTNETRFSVFPNPSNDLITVTSKTDEDIEKVVIFNALGEECLTVRNSLTINIYSLKPGYYQIGIFNDNNDLIGRQKLIVP